MPDLLTRMHATTKAGALGAGLIMLAVAVHFAEAAVVARAVGVILFIMLTAPVAAHAIGRAGYFVGVPFWERLEVWWILPLAGPLIIRGQRGWKRQPGGGSAGSAPRPPGTSRWCVALSGVRIGDRGQQRLGVGMLRMVQQVVDRRLLDDPAGVHHEDALGEVAHGGQVVGDEGQGQAALLWTPRSRCRISTRTEASSMDTGSSAMIIAGSQDQRPRDHHALLLAAAQHVRELRQELLRGRQADLLERLPRCAGRAPRGLARRGRSGARQDPAHVQERRQRPVGILLHVADAGPVALALGGC
jgi:multicomponent Na+:H+ antiporter subunit G